MANSYKAGLYCRLSEMDKANGYEKSIVSQKLALQAEANHRNILIHDFYVDVEYDGEMYNGPEFQRLVDDVKQKVINCIMVADLSRFGTNNSITAQYLELNFPKEQVRFIALEETIDTLDGDRIMPLQDCVKALYTKVISKKVRSVINEKAVRGEFLGSTPPFGYYKSSDEKGKLEIDEYASTVVRAIYQMALDGYGYSKIASVLRDLGVPNPASYQNGQYELLKEQGKDIYEWSVSTIKAILNNPVYIGDMVQGKRKLSETGQLVKVPKEEWITVKGTHEPIIEREQWEQLQKITKERKRSTKEGELQIFQGAIKCGDCGRAMTFCSRKYERYFTCSLYRSKGKEFCTMHYLKYDKLYDLVIKQIVKLGQQASLDPEVIKKKVLTRDFEARVKALPEKSEKLGEMTARREEVDKIIKHLYEDSVAGRLGNRRFEVLVADYEQELDNLIANINELDKEITEVEQKRDGIMTFLDEISTYGDIFELNRQIITTLIDRIEVKQIQGENGKSDVEMSVYYKNVGMLE